MKQSPLIAELIEAFTCLPGVGPRSAQRMVYTLLERNREGGRRLSAALQACMDGIDRCGQCRNFSETPVCPVCADPCRDTSTICVVESPADVLAIESAGSYQGLYFVLLGHLSPIDGIGPEELGLDKLEQRVREQGVQELILATGTTVEGEATSHYIHESIRDTGITLSRIAHGVPMGGDLEFVDGQTLVHALQGRRKIDQS